jgi:hypothetical protein
MSRLIVSSADLSVHFWNIHDGTCLVQFHPQLYSSSLAHIFSTVPKSVCSMHHNVMLRKVEDDPRKQAPPQKILMIATDLGHVCIFAERQGNLDDAPMSFLRLPESHFNNIRSLSPTSERRPVVPNRMVSSGIKANKGHRVLSVSTPNQFDCSILSPRAPAAPAHSRAVNRCLDQDCVVSTTRIDGESVLWMKLLPSPPPSLLLQSILQNSSSSSASPLRNGNSSANQVGHATTDIPQWIYVGYESGRVCIWNGETAQRIKELHTHSRGVSLYFMRLKRQNVFPYGAHSSPLKDKDKNKKNLFVKDNETENNGTIKAQEVANSEDIDNQLAQLALTAQLQENRAKLVHQNDNEILVSKEVEKEKRRIEERVRLYDDSSKEKRLELRHKILQMREAATLDKQNFTRSCDASESFTFSDRKGIHVIHELSDDEESLSQKESCFRPAESESAQSRRRTIMLKTKIPKSDSAALVLKADNTNTLFNNNPDINESMESKFKSIHSLIKKLALANTCKLAESISGLDSTSFRGADTTQLSTHPEPSALLGETSIGDIQLAEDENGLAPKVLARRWSTSIGNPLIIGTPMVAPVNTLPKPVTEASSSMSTLSAPPIEVNVAPLVTLNTSSTRTAFANSSVDRRKSMRYNSSSANRASNQLSSKSQSVKQPPLIATDSIVDSSSMTEVDADTKDSNDKEAQGVPCKPVVHCVVVLLEARVLVGKVLYHRQCLFQC